jgi:hypothetical protein
MEAASSQGARQLRPAALPLALCRELVCITHALAVVGYRPCVRSLTLHELLRAQPQLLPVVAAARQIVLEAVEAAFDCCCAVWPETTSLISWTAGAALGWHADNNRCALAAAEPRAAAASSARAC